MCFCHQKRRQPKKHKRRETAETLDCNHRKNPNVASFALRMAKKRAEISKTPCLKTEKSPTVVKENIKCADVRFKGNRLTRRPDQVSPTETPYKNVSI